MHSGVDGRLLPWEKNVLIRVAYWQGLLFLLACMMSYMLSPKIQKHNWSFNWTVSVSACVSMCFTFSRSLLSEGIRGVKKNIYIFYFNTFLIPVFVVDGFFLLKSHSTKTHFTFPTEEGNYSKMVFRHVLLWGWCVHGEVKSILLVGKSCFSLILVEFLFLICCA